MNPSGMQRLQRIVDDALDPARKPLTNEQKLQLLAELYSTPRKGDLFSSLPARTDRHVEPATQDT